MSSTRALIKRAALPFSTTTRQVPTPPHTCRRRHTSTSAGSKPPSQQDSLKIFACPPTWSVRSLLPAAAATPQDQEIITPSTLHHLLRLSALPPPRTPDEESSLLSTLHTQLHFVRDIQSVDTTGVPPLRAIRDERDLETATVTLDVLRGALDREEVVGFRKRPRRVRNEQGDRMRTAEEKLVDEATSERRERGYFVVESGKAKGGE